MGARKSKDLDEADKASGANATEIDWDSDSEGAWGLGNRGNRRRYSRIERGQPESGIIGFVNRWCVFGCGRTPLAKGDWFSEVAESINQLDDDEWVSKDNLPADFVVANDPPMERENLEDIRRIFYTAIDNTFSAIIAGETAIDVPHSTDISQLRLAEASDAPDVSIHFSELDEKGSTAVFSDVRCSNCQAPFRRMRDRF